MTYLVSLRQRSRNNFLDAHGKLQNYHAFGNSFEDNDSQRWILDHIADIYSFQLTGWEHLYLDAYDSWQSSTHNYRTALRTQQFNNSQYWIELNRNGIDGEYKYIQASSGRFLDAYQFGNDFSVVTRRDQDDDSQTWELNEVTSGEDRGSYRLQQKSTGRLLASVGGDVLQTTDTGDFSRYKEWKRVKIDGGVYRMRQVSSNRNLDAVIPRHLLEPTNVFTSDNSASDGSQYFVFIKRPGSHLVTIQQLITGYYLDAHDDGILGNVAFTNMVNQDNNSQRWEIIWIGDAPSWATLVSIMPGGGESIHFPPIISYQ